MGHARKTGINARKTGINARRTVPTDMIASEEHVPSIYKLMQ
jgi:hypothetical protein